MRGLTDKKRLEWRGDSVGLGSCAGCATECVVLTGAAPRSGRAMGAVIPPVVTTLSVSS